MKVIVTGGTGMVGGEFVRQFTELGAEVYSLARNSSSSRMIDDKDSTVIRADVLDRDSIDKIFLKIKPDIVIHMAAQAYNGVSWDCERLTHQTNYFGTLNVLHSCKLLKESGIDIKVLLACSSAEYGNISEDECPLKESTPLRPWTPYGVSKVGTEMLGRQYSLNYDMKVFLPRMFIHVGTGHPPATAIQNFARQLAMIKKGIIEPEMHVGNLTTSRDFIDVRDGVRAMISLIQNDVYGEAINICNSKAYKMSDILDMLIEVSGVEVNVVQDPALMRSADEPLLLGDNSRIVSLGYERKYEMKQTLKDVFDDWMSRV